jgi:hypothetical protein
VAHEGLRFNCDACPFSATRGDKLQLHKDAVHRGVRFACHLCPYAAGRKAGLEKTRVFLKRKPAQWFFCFFLVFLGFFFWGGGFFVIFLYIFAQKREFLGFFSVKNTFRCIQTFNYNHSY